MHRTTDPDIDRGPARPGRLSASSSKALLAGLLTLFVLAAEEAPAQLRPGLTSSFAAADSAATAYTNPAGMSRLDRPEFLVRTLVAYRSTQFEVDPETTTPGGDSDKNDGIILIPSLFYATPAFHDRLRLGFSLNVPSGIGSDYGDDWSGRYVATESSLVYIAVNGAASVRLTDWLSLGGGIEILYTSSTSKSKINNALEALPDGEIEYEASGIGIGGVISILVEIDRALDFESRLGRPLPLRLGLAYRPETETDIDGVPEIKGAGPLLGAALLANGLLGRSVELTTTSPQRVQAGVYVEPIEGLSFTVDFSWIDMEEFGSVDVSVSNTSTTIDADYQDTYVIGGSIGWQITDQTQLLFGAGYLSPPISDSNRSLSLPFGRIWSVGAGARHRFLDWLELYGTLNYYDSGDAPIDTEPSTRSGRVKGEFSPNYAIGVDIGLAFRF